ncbi:FMRFamide receptor [Anabrus simplex]|uniref:FMRFamide receptor n=1 Tax=Anabrus simplex TaxID=316456 RepID=UPI0034DDA5D4
MEEWGNYSSPAATRLPPEDLRASEHFRNASRFWIQRVLVPIVVIIGVLGNLVTVVILTRRRMRSSTNMYLTALAASDLLYLVFMFTMSLEHYPNIHHPAYYSYWEYRRFGLWFTDATSSSSIWLTVSFTVERYIAVCHPLRGRVLCTESRARKVIVVVFTMCFLATATTPFEWRVFTKPDGSVDLDYSTLGKNELYRSLFYWFSSIIFMILPLILLGIFNSFLVRAVHRSQRQRCNMTQVEHSDSVQTQENRITIILIAVVILFMVCQLPTAITLIYKTFNPTPSSFTKNVLRGLGNIFNFLVAIHSACNFLLYCALSDKYRRTFLITFLPQCYQMSQTNSAASSGGNFPSVRLSQRGYSLRAMPIANGTHSAADTALKRHVSEYIPRPHLKSKLPPPPFFDSSK